MFGRVAAINPYTYIYDYGGGGGGGRRKEQKEERLIKYYSSSHSILLVGDGDFSFSLCLACAFGSASNIVATSLDSYDELMKKYNQARSNVYQLNSLGAQVIHGVDATKMRHHTHLQERKFDRIIFNFPHAGFYGKEDNNELIKMHRSVVQGFFRNASGMLRRCGEIHVNHKKTAPFCLWDLKELAGQSSLDLIDCVEFARQDYPGYNHKRGSGPRSDEPFPLNESCTYKFKLRSMAESYPHVSKSNDIAPRRPPQALDIPVTFLPRETEMPFVGYVENRPRHIRPLQTSCVANECSGLFDYYFDHVIARNGMPDYDVYYSTRELLRMLSERYLRGAWKRFGWLQRASPRAPTFPHCKKGKVQGNIELWFSSENEKEPGFLSRYVDGLNRFPLWVLAFLFVFSNTTLSR